jgi:hypothetical protein
MEGADASQIKFDVEWKEVIMKPLISGEQLLDLHIKDKGTSCNNCQKVILVNEPLSICL